MKLIYCTLCRDIRRLSYSAIRCACGGSEGVYEQDGRRAWISGLAVPIGFDNSSWYQALDDRPTEGDGSRFTAFVIPKQCPTVREVAA